MKRDFLTIRHRAMTNLESAAFAMYAGNIINAANREGVKVSCSERIRKAWDHDSRARERWIDVADKITSHLDRNPFCDHANAGEWKRVPKGKRQMRAFDVASLVVIAGFLGGVAGYLLAQL